MSKIQKFEVPIQGMDCVECTLHVQHAIAALPGVKSVTVLLAAERATVQLDPVLVDLPMIRRAVAAAGYQVPEVNAPVEPPPARTLQNFTRPIMTIFGIVFGVVLFGVVFGEWLGWFEKVTDWVPFPVGVGLVLLFGFPVFKNVIQAALRKQIIAHTLMTMGVIAALAVGEWATAAVAVFFMRVGDYAEKFTTERARKAVRDLTALAPQTARVERGGAEMEIPVNQVAVGEVVIVRPGEKIPVDGEVLEGQATLDQAAITGESMPVEAGPGARVYAATLAQLGSLRVRAAQVGADTTFGRVVRMVEEAEANRADVQRLGDRFAAGYLPVVASIALATYLISRNPLSTAAVLLVACSCSFALATPIAMLASVGAGAKHGLLIKGGRYLELLAKADTLLIDKTGTLTSGKPRLTDVVPLNGLGKDELLRLAASAERYSEHPLAEAVRSAALERELSLLEPRDFSTDPGRGVRAAVNGVTIEVGSWRMLGEDEIPARAAALESQGKTLLYVRTNGALAGVLAAADALRPEAPGALAELKGLGVKHIELLTGDNERTAQAAAGQLGIAYRANLLPEDKIRIVKEYQAEGRTVVMMGDGVNDAPALAQANVGIAMGAYGSDVAIEAAHIALLRDDWSLLPRLFRIARRTMHVVKMNFIFTLVYNTVGLTLAAFGILPPILAAALQSLPDLGILGNSSRLLKQD
ncbi:copper-(or silver)-translocating P-type ATPase [Longilinea arvoryzae]|uniref:Copper-(Or silver)-translocating P-type ATPase n=1 Tax=Longilinea arvoryzae TaxID=360412 RepID=A0A0S7BDJ3_9CHLR|nr:cation-translocating P-type ATPase [Longilinea arvoryzae]GAP12422.1 copper-(or silver)-translocating P-type ATPase [Longilinea arvoryzae]